MNETPSKRLLNFAFFKKLKSIKHLEIVVAVILGAVALAIYFGSSTSGVSSGTSSEQSGTKIVYTNASDYSKELEDKLSKAISTIKGVGSAVVSVVLSSSSELIIAKNVVETSKKEVGSNGVITENITKEETPLIVSQSGKNEPLILLEILPKVAGVVVVAQGANDVNVKLNILSAVQALLQIPSGNIEIIEGK